MKLRVPEAVPVPEKTTVPAPEVKVPLLVKTPPFPIVNVPAPTILIEPAALFVKVPLEVILAVGFSVFNIPELFKIEVTVNAPPD